MSDEPELGLWVSGSVGINRWCPECGCGNDYRGYAHLSSCRSSREKDKKFSVGQLVKLKHDFIGLSKGTIGTIVYAYNVGTRYEVELSNPNYHVLTFSHSEIEAIE